MKLSLMRFSDADQVEGRVSDRQRAEHERQVRAARLEEARRQTAWTEIPETTLVRRGPFLVDSDADAVFVVRRGHVVEPGRATIGYVPDKAAMTYFVGRDGHIVFVEPYLGATTWSEIVARKACR
jgi:hypothetical protein